MKTFEQIYKANTFYDVNKKIWRGPENEYLYGAQDSIGEVALRSLLKHPERIAQICFHNDKKYTNREIAKWSLSVAEYFKKLDLEQCDIIGICASNSDYLAPLFFGAMLAGLTLSPLDPSSDKDEIKHIYSITKPKLIFCDGGAFDNVRNALEELKFDTPIYTMKDHRDGVCTIHSFLKENVDVQSYRAKPLKFGSDQVAVILSSSGTTGKPKAVCMSHRDLVNHEVLGTDASGSFLTFSAISWTTGVMTLVACTINGGTRIIVDRSFCVDDFLEIVQKYKVTHVFTAPSAIGATIASPKLKDHDLSSILIYFSGGSILHYSLVEKLLPHVPNAKVATVYGITEVGNAITLGEASPDNSNGKLIPNISIKILGDDGEHLGPTDVGEICIKRMFPWAGYYGNKEATKDIYKDGWIHTGDLGYFDETGRLYIIDRKKDILKYNNYQYSPTEIEEVINRLPGVGEVCVCGIPDLVSGFLPAAAIVRAEGSTLTEKQVYDHVANNTAHYKHLRGGVYFLESLPKTTSGKNIRRQVTSILEKLRNCKASKG